MELLHATPTTNQNPSGCVSTHRITKDAFPLTETLGAIVICRTLRISDREPTTMKNTTDSQERFTASDLFGGGSLSLRLGRWLCVVDVDQRGPGRYYASLRLLHSSELVSAGGYCDNWQGPYGLEAAIRNAWWHGRGMALGFGCQVDDLPLQCPFKVEQRAETQLTLF